MEISIRMKLIGMWMGIRVGIRVDKDGEKMGIKMGIKMGYGWERERGGEPCAYICDENNRAYK